MTEADALEQLVAMVDADTDPTLDPIELLECLAVGRRTDPSGNSPRNLSTAPAWATATAHVFGDVIHENRRWWRCHLAGTTAATEPTWPELEGRPLSRASIYDGTVTWVDNGGAWAPTFNLDAAAAAGWRRKAGKVAPRFDFTTDGQQFRRSQLFAHCMEMAVVHEGRVGGSASFAGGR